MLLNTVLDVVVIVPVIASIVSVSIPAWNVSIAVAASGTVFLKYKAFACAFVRSPVDDDAKNDGLYWIPLNHGYGGFAEDLLLL